MLSYIFKRFCLAIAVIAMVMAALFIMIYAVPGDPARVALGPRATPEMIAELKIRMGLDQPLWVQIYSFYASILQGDLGRDVISGEPVLRIIMSQLPDTLYLVLGSVLIAVIPGVFLGNMSAQNRGSMSDKVISILTVSVMAVPSFVIAIYLLLIFSINLNWFPAIGTGYGFWGKTYQLILPSIAVGLAWVGYIARVLRASILEEMNAQHVRTAHAFGLSSNRIMYNYILRIAILPTITILGLGIGQMLSGAIFAEIVFARPGLGKLVYDAIVSRNYPIVTGTVLITTAMFLLFNIAADILIAWLDPRVRHDISR